MPCRVDICPKCDQYDCGGYNGPCRYNGKPPAKPEKATGFDTAGALCDVLTLLEDKYPQAFYDLDTKVHDWWRAHEDNEKDRVKKEAMAKLTARERRALGLKD